MSSYFTQYKHYFWNWDIDDSESSEAIENAVIEIPQEGTLVYEGRLREILNALAEKGLPQLGSIILILLSATVGFDEEAFARIKQSLWGHLDQHKFGNQYIKNVHQIMDYVHNLPTELRIGNNLIYLLEVLFEESHNRKGIQKSKQILRGENAIKNAARHNYYLELTTRSTYEKDTRPIALMVRRFKSMQDLINALTNVPIIKEDPEEELLSQLDPVYNTETSIVDQLIEHKETVEIGSLIKRIWSGLHIPMHQNAASEQPLGGVSDITNKGDMSRLLISEFAYDQDTFLSRVANKEALYIERETANEENDNRRVFLIDASLKNWGIPKILSFATALAIATHPKSTFEYDAYLVGDSVHSINFDDILEIISGQQVLSAQLDPAIGLHEFYQDYITPTDEVFLLTTEETLESNDLQYVITDNVEQLHYLITTSSSGHIDFYRYLNRSRKHLKQIHLPYEELWKQQKPKKKELAVNFKNTIDEIVEDNLLTPLLKSEAKYILYQDQVFVLQSGHLYSFTSSGASKGLQLIYNNVVAYKNSAYCINFNANNDLIFHEYNAFAKAYYITNLETGKSTSNRKYSKNLEGKCGLLSIENKIIVYCDRNYYQISENEIKKIHVTMSSNLLKQRTAKQQLIASCRKSLNTKLTNYSVLKNIEEIKTIDFYDGLTLVIDKYHLDTYSNKLLFNQNDYSYLDHKEKKKLSPIIDLYLKRGNLENIKNLREILKISLSEAKTFLRNAPVVIKDDIDQQVADKLKKELESKGLTCYIKTKKFQTENGSLITLKNGKLYFQSSVSSGLNFSMTCIIKQPIAFASDMHFTGNEYFLPVKHELITIEYSKFRELYLIPFFNS
ncbi:ribosomal protein L7/L12 [Nonlabens sp. Asnod3-A02]|uniref:ribosomal protein L7/L12 n=1 Tax=Nonlabens sp. Asnod3-A02 TaxID=3160579 RepID=UPI0038635431